MTVEAFAPAKVNLTLHVTGVRADGYHLLDSLVVFAGVGDRIVARRDHTLSLEIDGPMAAKLDAGNDNLVLRAARLLGDEGAAVRLTKNLPIASGIGGGSSDAAATLRALAQLWQRTLPASALTAVLGADVPVCLEARSRRMGGVGDQLLEVPQLPPCWLVLVNPGVAVPTADVFRALVHKDGSPMPVALPVWQDATDLADFVKGQRNDLEPAARAIAPQISKVLNVLGEAEGCLIARMSGSGATCFGLFADEGPARAAANRIRKQARSWWVKAAPILR
jgi:4-diphosphocytidyl-2-C-methyl-D-erythritol kinase